MAIQECQPTVSNHWRQERALCPCSPFDVTITEASARLPTWIPISVGAWCTFNSHVSSQAA